MEYTTSLLFLLSLVWTCVCVFTFLPSRRRKTIPSATRKLPPGPPPYPIIGNFLELGNKPHESLAKLSKKYGSLMSLKLASTTTIVISSPETAKQVLQKYDHVLSDRSVGDSPHALDHHKFSMVWLPAGSRWRSLRKVCAIQLFIAQRLDASHAQGLRRQKVHDLLDHVQESCDIGQTVEIGRTAFTTSLNLLSNTFFSIDLGGYTSESSQEFKNLVWGVMEETGRPNFADYIPVLRFIDPQGVRRRTKIYFMSLFSFFDGIIDQRLKMRASSAAAANNDVLDALLKLAEESDELTMDDFKHLLMDLFVAGTDTTSSTLEWAMAELMHNPTKMVKAKNELQEVLNKDTPVVESDIAKLPYLQAIIKETFRLHPAAPLLLPHQAREDVEIDGYIVPKDAKVLVNVWAIGRDPSTWSDPNSFVPERFLDSEIDVKGQDFELLPFGAGRRICPGMSLAHRMVHLVLASLLHSFDWKLGNGQKFEDMDMNDMFGITLQKAEPLQLIPIKV